MDKAEFYYLLNQYKTGNKEKRKDSLRSLKEMEAEERIAPNILIQLLEEEKDQALISYAVGYIRRTGTKVANKQLIKIYQTINNPVLLVELLNTFAELKSPDFIEPVLARISSAKKAKTKQSFFSRKIEQEAGENEVFDQKFIEDLILVPSLKFLQKAGDKGVANKVEPFLEHKDPKIRWNTLVLFDRLEISLEKKILEKISQNDPNALTREQSLIMLAKQN